MLDTLTVFKTELIMRLKSLLLFSILLAFLAFPAFAANQTEALLDQVIDGAHRDPKNKARDIYRHPKETLLFFGLKPNMIVVEIWPGGGWYTEILAPVLRDKGRLYAASFAVNAKNTPEFRVEIERDYLKKLSQHPEIYNRIIRTQLQAPEYVNIGPHGKADMVLTFRNVHNWAKDGNAEATFKAFYDVLKPGGILGVIDHRAKPGTPLQDMIRSGYLTEELVIGLAKGAGFKLAAKSEINANPKDTKDHPKGVWTLPPMLRLGDQDREKYLAIGESDRMTLKFVKPK
ncbi:MAG TPA: methyltransferase [Burkholderiales bacterium]|nr:methyltransferase [Burkholderiales bacterium]